MSVLALNAKEFRNDDQTLPYLSYRRTAFIYWMAGSNTYDAEAAKMQKPLIVIE